MIRPSGPQCLCAAGFQGNGTSCQGHKNDRNNSNNNNIKIIRADGVCVCVYAAVDACQHANGGCSELAVCKRTQPGRRECVCGSGYHGDGLVCVGTCSSILLSPVTSSLLPLPPCSLPHSIFYSSHLASSPCFLLLRLLFYPHFHLPPSFLLSVSFSSQFPPSNSSLSFLQFPPPSFLIHFVPSFLPLSSFYCSPPSFPFLPVSYSTQFLTPSSFFLPTSS